jgi:hypothetical protein
MEVDGLCAARNVALEDAALFGLPCLQLSDDLRRIVVAKNREDWTPEVPRYVRDSDVTFDQLVADMLLQMNTYNVSLVGVAPTDSLLGYPGDNMPPRQRSFILGDCMLIRPTPLRFDTNLQLKEDYDFTAQHLARYGKVLRLDNWLLSFEHRTNAGGACDRRNPLTENAAVTYLQAKWGRDVFVRRLPPKHLEVAFRWPQNGIVPADSDGVVAARRV